MPHTAPEKLVSTRMPAKPAGRPTCDPRRAGEPLRGVESLSTLKLREAGGSGELCRCSAGLIGLACPTTRHGRGLSRVMPVAPGKAHLSCWAHEIRRDPYAMRGPVVGQVGERPTDYVEKRQAEDASDAASRLKRLSGVAPGDLLESCPQQGVVAGPDRAERVRSPHPTHPVALRGCSVLTAMLRSAECNDRASPGGSSPFTKASGDRFQYGFGLRCGHVPGMSLTVSVKITASAPAQARGPGVIFMAPTVSAITAQHQSHADHISGAPGSGVAAHTAPALAYVHGMTGLKRCLGKSVMPEISARPARRARDVMSPQNTGCQVGERSGLQPADAQARWRR